MTQDIPERIRQVVSDVFGVPIEEVNDENSPDTVRGWDSMSHINLILALEAEFSVSISPEDAMEMLSVRLIRMIVLDINAKRMIDVHGDF